MSSNPTVETGTVESSTEPIDGQEQLVVEDLLVEEVSIDGMCGVY
jgi:mycofactocin precursor